MYLHSFGHWFSLRIEGEVLRLVRQRTQIENYFLLDIEFPYLFRASREGERAIAIRFSEDESIELAKKLCRQSRLGLDRYEH